MFTLEFTGANIVWTMLLLIASGCMLLDSLLAKRTNFLSMMAVGTILTSITLYALLNAGSILKFS